MSHNKITSQSLQKGGCHGRQKRVVANTLQHCQKFNLIGFLPPDHIFFHAILPGPETPTFKNHVLLFLIIFFYMLYLQIVYSQIRTMTHNKQCFLSSYKRERGIALFSYSVITFAHISELFPIHAYNINRVTIFCQHNSQSYFFNIIVNICKCKTHCIYV